MKEKTSILNNMSSPSRSSVSVRPRHVAPPTLGARVRSDVGVRISLSLRRDISIPTDESQFITEVAKRFIPDHRLVDPVNYEEKLRE